MNRLSALLFLATSAMAAQSGPSYDNAPPEIALVSSTGAGPFSAMTTTGSSGQPYDYAQPFLMLGYNSTTHKYYVCGDANPCTGSGAGGGFTAGGDLSGTPTSQNVVGSHITAGGAAFTSPVTVALASGGTPLSLTSSQSGLVSLLMQDTLAGGLANGSDVYKTLGISKTTGNAIAERFHFVSDNNSGNLYGIGFWGVADALDIFRNGNISIGTQTDAGFKLDVGGSARAVTYNTATNCTSTASPAVCGAAAAGKVQVAAAATTLQINSTAITANTGCWFTYTVEGITSPANMSSLLAPYISARAAGTSLTITLPVAPVTSPVNILYGCVN